MYKMRKMKDKEERIARAVAYFKAGYNCSQSVVAAFADLYGFTEKQAFHMADWVVVQHAVCLCWQVWIFVR